MSFSALVLSLPTRNSTVRMRVWRALKGTGCGVLRDGVYLLPRESPGARVFPGLEQEVRAANGFAMTVGLEFDGPEQLDHARRLFDRSAAYGALVEQVRDAKAALGKPGRRSAELVSRRLQRAFDDLAAIDFFPGEAKAQAQAAVQDLQQQVRRLQSGGEPHATQGAVKRVNAGRFRKRLWATRKSPWVDRLASVWLIKRFIDKQARFAWIESPRHFPKGAVGFDFNGAAFTHVGSLVTYEVLLASFGLEADAALASIGAAVHFLDAGGIPVADARGLETMLRGIRENARSDDETASRAFAVFDAFYSAYRTN